MITKTLGEIYLKQGDLRKAYEIFKALAAQDPSDQSIQKKLIELSESLGISPSSRQQADHSREERIRMLKRVLSNIRERRRR